MVRVLAPSAVDHGFEPRCSQTKDYNIGKNAALRSKNKIWSSQNNVSEWNDIQVSTHRLVSMN